MDFSTIHWGALTREFPSPLPIQTIGYEPRKTEWMRRSFASCNFSFIISGAGYYRNEGVMHRIEAPCVLTQWPEEPMAYGPNDGHTWEELYFIYQPEAYAALQNCRFMTPQRRWWTISDPARWRGALKDLLMLSRQSRESVVDQIDRCCERLILASLSPQPGHPPLPNADTALTKIRHEIEADLTVWPNFSALAQRAGMSETTFRRTWARETGHPPARYLAEMKIKEACRLLVETRLTVGEIGLALGYEDPLYFSRKFHTFAGCTATEYRRTYQT